MTYRRGALYMTKGPHLLSERVPYFSIVVIMVRGGLNEGCRADLYFEPSPDAPSPYVEDRPPSYAVQLCNLAPEHLAL
jgi:hypothetical protein